ncbi:MAG: AAA family ATPase [Deltaproteobacteria bacterium]|nr:AAA family ATPase [Deltaproteobacteria bacterium]
MDLTQHLELLARLLDLERRAEADRFKEAEGRLSLQERDARGTAIAQAELIDEGGLAGRFLLTFGKPGGGELGASKMGAGSLVRLRPRRQGEVPEEELPRGVVARRQRHKLSIALDAPPPEWVSEGRVAIELLPSAVTYERLTGAIRRLRDTKEGKRWHAVLSGEKPRFEVRRDLAEMNEYSLNNEQRAAVALCESAQDLALVHGPPGTGKTTVLIEVIVRAAARGEKVLACAPSNLAVDNLVERLAAAGLHPVRVGHPARVLPTVLEHTLEERTKDDSKSEAARELVKEALRLRREAQKRHQKRGPGRFSESREQEREARRLFAEARRLEDEAERDVLDRARVILSTLTGLEGTALSGRRFELAVIDEATQAVEPAAYLAMLRADRAVLAGDHQQLSPTILSEEAARPRINGVEADGLSLSLFERLARPHTDKAGLALPDAPMVTLLEQHRMHETIMRFPSDELYGGKLRPHPRVAAWTLEGAEALPPLLVIDTAGRGYEEETPQGSESKVNPGEAEVCAREVQRLLAGGVLPQDIAVIAPYDAQVQKIRALLDAHLDNGLEVDSVDGFQGREKDAVVLSLVRSNDTGELGFLGELRRMNVALTRAKKKLIVVGDGATLCRHPFYDRFFEHAKRVGGWVSVWEREA